MLAQAQPVTGLYVGAGFGANMLDKTDITPTSADQRALGTLGAEYSWGYAGVLSLGWGYGNGLRTEIEGNYRSNDVSDFTANNAPARGATGTALSYGAMLNVSYNIDLGGALGGITPLCRCGPWLHLA
ncbi:MAG: hypothetical protein LW713_07430 [Acetobacteraceae bacterium]|nr:hypothetical protein [Acetobacteraceae bacterium]